MMNSLRLWALTLFFLSWTAGGFAMLAFGMLRYRRNVIIRMLGYIIGVLGAAFALGWGRSAFFTTPEDVARLEWSAWQATVVGIYVALLGGLWYAAFYLLGIYGRPGGDSKQAVARSGELPPEVWEKRFRTIFREELEAHARRNTGAVNQEVPHVPTEDQKETGAL